MLKKKLKRIFLTGLAVVIPAGLTLYILSFIIDMMDNLLRVIPPRYQPDNLFGIHVPGPVSYTHLTLPTIYSV